MRRTRNRWIRKSACARWSAGRMRWPTRLWRRCGCGGSLPEVGGCADTLDAAISEALACRRCEAVLPLGPRPVFRVSDTARVLIVGQAPGTKVHMTGVPWNDASGDRLRSWLLMDRDLFYDVERIAIVPVGLCYPGRLPRGGDAPPRPE